MSKNESDPRNRLRKLTVPATLLAAGLSIAALSGGPAGASAPKSHGAKTEHAAKPHKHTHHAGSETTTTTTDPGSLFQANPKLAAAYNAERAKLQAELTPVSPEQLSQLEALVQDKGYLDPQLPNVRRLVVLGSNDVSYTAELDYVNPASSLEGNTLEAITVYIDRPGQAHAEQVIVDGADPLIAPGEIQTIDGIVDIPLGYMPITNEQIDQDTDKYGFYGPGMEDNEALAQYGQEAQQDYITAVGQILTGTIVE